VVLALFLAAVTPLVVAASPTPVPTPPEIGRVRANALCSTLRTAIGPSVMGLMKNDDLIGAGHRAFAKMGADSAGTSGAAIDIDKLYLEQVETRLVHNLKVIDTLLSDRTHFPANPKTDDERTAVALRDNLAAVADAQRKALDLVSGTLETESLGQMQHEFNDQMTSATGPASPLPAATDAPASFIGSAGLPDTADAPGLPTTSDKTSSLMGHTIYDQINRALEVTQAAIARRERAATPAVVTAASSCSARAQPAPSPTATP
jgi:hypothetical protein